MHRLIDLSLKWKLIVATTATTSVALSVAFVMLLVFDRHESRQEMMRQLTSLGAVIGSTSSAALVFDDAKAGAETLTALRFHPNVIASSLYTAAGDTLASYRRDGMGAEPMPAHPGPDGVRLENGRLLLFEKVLYRGEAIGTVYIEADTSPLTTRQVRYGLVVLCLAIASVATAFLVAARLQLLVLRPVLALAAVAKTVADEKNYSLRVPRRGRDEISDLTEAFNGMLIEIQARDEALKTAEAELRRHIQDLEKEMTDRKHAQEALRHTEAQLRHAQKMEAVGILAGGVAHDFNNLLQAMLNHVELIRSGHGESAQMAATMAELEAEIRRGSALTRQLLLFARRDIAKSEHLDLNEVIGSAATFLRRLVRANVIFSVELGDGPLAVTADRGQIDQVLMNLAVNAAEAMPDGGRLTIRSGREGQDWVWFSADDTGSGIPVEIRERIFEPFFTTKGKGTGLGLSVVHGIVTRHRGVVRFQDLPGGGTSFRVALPGAVPSEHPEVVLPTADISSAPVGHGERVLVVEDEEAARQGLTEILQILDYDAVAAGSGEEAQCFPHEPGFDVLLTDMMLPGIAGGELARGLLERWPKLKVILMSGYTEDEAVRRGALAGRVRFLQKPFDMGTLAREIRAALEK